MDSQKNLDSLSDQLLHWLQMTSTVAFPIWRITEDWNTHTHWLSEKQHFKNEHNCCFNIWKSSERFFYTLDNSGYCGKASFISAWCCVPCHVHHLQAHILRTVNTIPLWYRPGDTRADTISWHPVECHTKCWAAPMLVIAEFIIWWVWAVKVKLTQTIFVVG